MNDLDRLKTLTEKYAAMQGLRLVPAAVPIAFAGLGAVVEAPFGTSTGIAVFLALALVGGGGALLVGRWYARRFGTVEPPPELLRRWAYLCLAALAAIVAAALLDAWLHPPVILFGLVIAALLLLHWREIGGPRLHHLVGTAAIVVASALPLAGVGHSRAAAFVFLVLGTVYVAIGALDHRHLATTLGLPREAT